MLDRLSAKRIEPIEPSLSFRWQARQDRVQRNGLMRFGRVFLRFSWVEKLVHQLDKIMFHWCNPARRFEFYRHSSVGASRAMSRVSVWPRSLETHWRVRIRNRGRWLGRCSRYA